MEKGKGQGRSCLARRLLVRGGTKGPRTSRRFFILGSCSPLDLANTAPYSFRYRDIFFFIVPRDFLGNPLPCCKQSNLN